MKLKGSSPPVGGLVCSAGMRAAIVAALLAVSTGCSKDEADGAAQAEASVPRADPEQQASIEALGEGDVTALLAVLDRSHAQVRDAIGAHRLHYAADFDLAPAGEVPALPEVDAPVVRPQHVEDELTLTWGEPDEAGPRFRLDQENDHGRGRTVIVEGGKLRSRILPRPFMEGPLETDVYELWLDDAYTSVHDTLQLAAPWLSIEVEESSGGGLGDGPSLVLTLGHGQQRDVEAPPQSDRAAWRDDMKVSEISGSVVLDAETGVWMSADVTVQYALPGAAGRQMRGFVRLEGKIEPLAPGTVNLDVPAPVPAQPQRVRYEVEKDEILDGLAAP